MVEIGAEPDATLVGINSHRPNAIVSEGISLGAVPELAGYASLRREVKYGRNSRIDLLLEDGADGRPCYVEVKNVHFSRRQGVAEFPDSKTERGVKHRAELSDRVAAGHRAVMVYLIQRGDVESFTISADIDPVYAEAYTRARAAGVEMLAFSCMLAPEGIFLDAPVRITHL
jgi:sugar fermentation stimulation protein A